MVQVPIHKNGKVVLMLYCTLTSKLKDPNWYSRLCMFCFINSTLLLKSPTKLE